MTGNVNFKPNYQHIGQEFAQGFFSMMPTPALPSMESIDKTISQLGKMWGKMNHEVHSQMNSALVFNWGPTLLGFVLMTQGLPLAMQYIYQKLLLNIGKPKMAIEQRRTTLFTPIKKVLFGEPPKSSNKAIFNKDVTEQINQIISTTKNIQTNRAAFENIVLYGPPGTGKTMIAKKIAEDSDMDFIMMSSGNLTQFIYGKKHVSELNNLIDSAEKGSKPTVIFIDEAEGIARDRSKLDQEHIELLDALLARTGTPSNKIMLILATNQFNELDEAIKNRMSTQIHIGNPDIEQRIQIIDQYAKQLFEKSPNLSKVFNPAGIRKMAEKMDGHSGRSLFYLVNKLYSLEAKGENRTLTQKQVDSVIDRFALQAKHSSPKVSVTTV